VQPVGPTAVLLPRSHCWSGAGNGRDAGVNVREKTGDIFLTNEKGRCVAYWRPVDGSRDMFLCAVDLQIYNNHPHLRDLFVELATEVTINRGREAGDSVTLRVREPLPKSTAGCAHPM